jgi:hypothetical protein
LNALLLTPLECLAPSENNLVDFFLLNDGVESSLRRMREHSSIAADLAVYLLDDETKEDRPVSGQRGTPQRKKKRKSKRRKVSRTVPVSKWVKTVVYIHSETTFLYSREISLMPTNSLRRCWCRIPL